MAEQNQPEQENKGLLDRFLNVIEVAGNKLPDPAILFLLLMLIVWAFSALLSLVTFDTMDPRTVEFDADGNIIPGSGNPIEIVNLLQGSQLAEFLATMVSVFMNFAPLGVVLVAMLGVGVAEHSGYINVGLKKLLGFTPQSMLTPVLILVAIVSHTAADAGYVLVIPLGGVIFYAAGRHPLAGIAAAFAGVSGGFSANFIPSGIDPLLQGFTQSAAQIIDEDIMLNPLNNWAFTSLSSFLIVGVGWYITDKIVEPRLSKTKVDADEEDLPKMETVSPKESKAFWVATAAMTIGIVGLIAWTFPQDSPMRSPGAASVSAPAYGIVDSFEVTEGDEVVSGQIIGTMRALELDLDDATGEAFETFREMPLEVRGDGVITINVSEGDIVNTGQTVGVVQGDRSVTAFDAPIMQSIVPLIFLLFVIPGVVYGFLSGTYKTSKDMINNMSKAMESMAYYIVMAFFCALFIDAFAKSNIGVLIATNGANLLQSLALPAAITIVGIIFLTAFVNLLVGSASAKWALISPIFVPMLMQLGISPDLTQAAYRVGDSVSNIITPLLPYFPLVVVFCQRYVKNTGIGTLVSMMLPYFFIFMITWTIFLLVYWWLGIPLGLQASYTYPP